MPDSLPLLPLAPGRKRNAKRPQEGVGTQVSTDIETTGKCCLAPPPRDVGRLLERHGADLPQYLDVQRWQLIQESHRRWPLLQRNITDLGGDPK